MTREHTVLFVDDEVNILKALQRLLRAEGMNVVCASRGSEALEIGELPALQQAVEIHGFPVGGSGLAITSGIVSRIAVDHYAHSLTRLLLVQVDAAVNSGNSGGPALSDGKVPERSEEKEVAEEDRWVRHDIHCAAHGGAEYDHTGTGRNR